MKRIRLLIAGLAGLVVAALAVSSVSWTSPVSLRLADESGQPATDAYVVFHYYGHVINPVHSVTYVARTRAIVKATSDGTVNIPARVHIRRPLPLFTPPAAFIDFVYVPRLHNAFGPVAEQTMSRAGVFTIAENRDGVMIADVSGSPERWERSIHQLYDCIRDTLTPSGSSVASPPRDPATAAHVRELIVHLRREHAAFLETYRDVARQQPPESMWGQYVERMWKRNLEEVARFESILR